MIAALWYNVMVQNCNFFTLLLLMHELVHFFPASVLELMKTTFTRELVERSKGLVFALLLFLFLLFLLLSK
jgi:hypothetical protein